MPAQGLPEQAADQTGTGSLVPFGDNCLGISQRRG